MRDYYNLSFLGIKELEKKLQLAQNERFEAVKNKQITEMYNRGKSRGQIGSTPVSSGKKSGQLRVSLIKVNDGIGYVKDYAPHVEYGHRIVRNKKTIGHVQGRRFLRANVNVQKPIYKKDLIKQLERMFK